MLSHKKYINLCNECRVMKDPTNALDVGASGHLAGVCTRSVLAGSRLTVHFKKKHDKRETCKE